VRLAHLLARELGAGTEILSALKRSLDPHDVLNPGKLGL
jgi:FAD/FMN-containing dehydrogenase